ncbi:MAG: hypothetical protein KA074_02865 [Bacteroidales bacterium]|jgi:hypothetical protein|nr:hypothetical protein [Bacteroidales bacterium]
MEDSLDLFYKIEQEYKLFDLEEEDCSVPWDIFRHSVLTRMATPFEKNQRIRLTPRKLTLFVPILFKSILGLSKKKCNTLLFSANRYSDKDGLWYDKASEDICKFFETSQGNLLNLDNIKPGNEYKNRVRYNPLPIFKLIHKKYPKLSDNTYHVIREAFTDNVPGFSITYEFLNSQYRSFQQERAYYTKLFKRLSPKRIIFVQNGIQKGMIAAARICSIPIYEMQHGIYGRKYVLYYYPEIDNIADQFYPDIFFTFGSMWSKDLNAPTRIVPLGNNCFYNEPANDIRDSNTIVFISSIVHANFLFPIARELASSHPEFKIILKLHPGEFFRYDEIVQEFSKNSNVKVVRNEINIYSLFDTAALVVAINSTAQYEALDKGAKVAILKASNYRSQDICFDHPNLHLFENTSELDAIIASPLHKSEPQFFQQFNPDLLKEVLSIESTLKQ